MFAEDPELQAIDRLLDGLPVPADELDPVLRRTASVLQRTLVRFHPSFRFEEALAGRLQAEAADTSSPAQAGRIIPFRGPVRPESDQPERRTRGYLLGGAAIASASIAGAVVAWRHVRERPA